VRRSAFVLFFLVLLLLPVPSGTLSAQDDAVIFLVRHAERADDSGENPGMLMDPGMAEDPPLSEAGRARASLLAEMLRDAEVTHIHSTDDRRTRETAQPTAEATGLELALYDASDLGAFAFWIRSIPGRHLVIGHSNTTHSLVEALGGDPGLPIESLEYDRLYILTLENGVVRTILVRFSSGR